MFLQVFPFDRMPKDSTQVLISSFSFFSSAVILQTFQMFRMSDCKIVSFLNLIKSQEQPCRKISSLMSSSKHQFRNHNYTSLPPSLLLCDWNDDFGSGAGEQSATVVSYIKRPSHLSQLPSVFPGKTFTIKPLCHLECLKLSKLSGHQWQPAKNGP